MAFKKAIPKPLRDDWQDAISGHARDVILLRPQACNDPFDGFHAAVYVVHENLLQKDGWIGCLLICYGLYCSVSF